jgi:serine/threonine protein phosphatase 1
MLSRFFSGRPRERSGAPGYRAYAIGDIHGHLELLDDMLEQIRADHRSREPAAGILISLGDLVDRGPDSAGVVERLRTIDPGEFRFVGLSGNHEEVLLRVLDGDLDLLDQWLGFGGSECLTSYGLDVQQLASLGPSQQLAAVRDAIPDDHVAFLRSFGDTFRFGDYLFVHAGIRPGIPLQSQSPGDLRWIRRDFLEDSRDHGFTVVHGHTIAREVDERPNRIGIDTGAYTGGPLTALAIEGSSRWLLQVGVDGRHVPAT